MRKVKLYIAISLNGKIARNDGSVNWLHEVPNPDRSDYGYQDFYDSIGITLQGYTTYKQILDWGIEFPYAGKKNYVFTRKQDLEDTEHVEFMCGDPASFVKGLKEQEGQDIWLIGGAQICTLLVREDLVDELIIFVMPLVLSSGMDLFDTLPADVPLKLQKTKPYPGGVIELHYLPELPYK